MHGDTMKKKINVNYKTIFKYETHQETMQCESYGWLEKNNQKTNFHFLMEKNTINISLYEDCLYLEHGQSQLKLIKNKKVKNYYETDFGVLDLSTKLISLDTKNGVKIKYQIFDGNHMLSEVYVLLTYRVLENDNEKV